LDIWNGYNLPYTVLILRNSVISQSLAVRWIHFSLARICTRWYQCKYCLRITSFQKNKQINQNVSEYIFLVVCNIFGDLYVCGLIVMHILYVCIFALIRGMEVLYCRKPSFVSQPRAVTKRFLLHTPHFFYRRSIWLTWLKVYIILCYYNIHVCTYSANRVWYLYETIQLLCRMPLEI